MILAKGGDSSELIVIKIQWLLPFEKTAETTFRNQKVVNIFTKKEHSSEGIFKQVTFVNYLPNN